MAALTRTWQHSARHCRRLPLPPLSAQQRQENVVGDDATAADSKKATGPSSNGSTSGSGSSSGNGSGNSNNRGMGSSSISRGAGRLTGAGKELLALEEAKETGRRQWGKQKRFTHARWALHRSSSRCVGRRSAAHAPPRPHSLSRCTGR